MPVAIRPLAAKNQPAPLAYPATVVSVSDRSLDLKTEPAVDLRANDTIELEVDGTWNRCRVLWSKPGLRDTLIASVELHGGS